MVIEIDELYQPSYSLIHDVDHDELLFDFYRFDWRFLDVSDAESENDWTSWL